MRVWAPGLRTRAFLVTPGVVFRLPFALTLYDLEGDLRDCLPGCTWRGQEAEL